MSTHKAIATAAVRAPLDLIEVPTVQHVTREVRVRVEWTASTPLDLHQNDGGLVVKYPQILGSGVAGTVVEVGPMVRNLTITIATQLYQSRLSKPSKSRFQLYLSYLIASDPSLEASHKLPKSPRKAQEWQCFCRWS
jgi:NADPH:quinone reductase-like Zn-dependent oxidoreductase